MRMVTGRVTPRAVMTDTNSNKLLVWRVEQLVGPDDLSDEALDDGIEAVAVVMVSDPEDPESYGDMDMFFEQATP